MDATIADVVRFNESLDSTIVPVKLDEQFITARQAELEDISKDFDVAYLPFVALSYAKLMELTVVLAGMYADNCQSMGLGDLVVNPRHLDVCILNTQLIKEDYGITDNIPLWFKRQVQEVAGSQYSEDLGRMVVDPSLLELFVENGLLLRTVKKERHGRLSDQFRDCIQDAPRLDFPLYVEGITPVARRLAQVCGCGGGSAEFLDVACWLAGSTVLNIVKHPLKTDLMGALRDVMSDEYLRLINAKFEKAFNSLQYVSMRRKNFADFPYNDDLELSEWDKISRTLCYFTLDDYGVIQSELYKSLSSPCYRSPLLKSSVYNVTEKQDTGWTQMSTNIMNVPASFDMAQTTMGN